MDRLDSPHTRAFQKYTLIFTWGFHLKIQGYQEDKDMYDSEFTRVWDGIVTFSGLTELGRPF